MNSFNSLQTAISHLELQGFHSSLADYLHGYMTSTLASIVIIVCFGVLMVISVIALTGADTTAFFTANRQSLQYLVAFGMTGFSLSAVTSIPVPGNVGKIGFGRFLVVYLSAFRKPGNLYFFSDAFIVNLSVKYAL